MSINYVSWIATAKYGFQTLKWVAYGREIGKMDSAQKYIDELWEELDNKNTHAIFLAALILKIPGFSLKPLQTFYNYVSMLYECSYGEHVSRFLCALNENYG